MPSTQNIAAFGKKTDFGKMEMEVGQQQSSEPLDTNIAKLLSVGKNVKTRLYAELVRRVGAGEILNTQEIASFDRLHKELSGENEAPSGPSLPNPTAIATYLHKCGYKVSKSAVYNHTKDGKLRPQADGSYAVADVDTYAKLYLPLLAGAPSEMDGAQRAKLAEETRKTRAQAAHWEIKAAEAAGAVVPADWKEKDLAARAIVLRSDFSNWAHTECARMISLVNGDPELLPDLIAFTLAAGEMWFARYSGDREFTAELPAPGAAPAARDDDFEEEE
jgi:hypothetical protein